MNLQQKPKLFVMLSRIPFPLEKGDKLRAYYQIKEFSKVYSITLVCITDQAISNHAEDKLKTYCDTIHVFKQSKLASWFFSFLALFSQKPLQVGYFYSPFIQKKINLLLKNIEPDHIYCQLVRASEYVKNYHTCSKTIDYMDAFSMGIKRRISMQPIYLKWIFKLEHKRLAKYEREIYDYFELHTIISEQDKKIVGTSINQKIHCIANGVSESFTHYITNESPKYDLVFVGNLNYPPNVEAVKYILKNILPLSQKKGYSWRFLAAGAEPAQALIDLFKGKDHAVLLANVVDIRQAYTSGKVFLAPMTIGTGLQNKLLEAMALGIPCVTSKLANDALGAVDELEIAIADTPEEYVDKISLLLQSEESEKFGQAGKAMVEKRYNWHTITQELIDLMQKA